MGSLSESVPCSFDKDDWLATGDLPVFAGMCGRACFAFSVYVEDYNSELRAFTSTASQWAVASARLMTFIW